MLRLLYLSQSKCVISDAEIYSILESSRRNNSAHGITGVLVYGGGSFAQVLEGPQHEVLRMYVKILDDLRHGNWKIIHITPIDERIFKDWSMGGIKRKDCLNFDQLFDLQNFHKETVSAKVATDFMHEFLKVLKAGQ